MKSITPILTMTLSLTALVFAVPATERLGGTLVVAVPVKEGLVVCADKRLFNIDAGTYTDNNVKIRKVGDKALFVATGTVGFYDSKTRKTAFDAFDVTSNYLSRNTFVNERKFWDGLKGEIRNKLREYFATRSYDELPASDKASNNLLFNLIFYSIDGGVARSHTVRVFYEKKRSPLVSIDGPLTEAIRFAKLGGKGRDLMTYLGRNTSLAADPLILSFDERRFNIEQTSITSAVEFAARMFRIANTGIPEAHISPSFDCALLSHQQEFKWIEIKLTPTGII